MIVFIDDIRQPPHDDDIVAREPHEAIAALRLFEEDGFEEVWFDHDLGLDFDVWDVVRFLERRYADARTIHIGTCVVHSMNPVGGQRLAQALDRLGYRVVRQRTVIPENPLTRS